MAKKCGESIKIQKPFVCLYLHLLAIGMLALISVNNNTKYTVLSKKETIPLQKKTIYKNNNHIL